MTRPLRVVYVVDRFPVLSETFVLGELLELVRRGEDVTVVARAPGDPTPLPDELARRTRYAPSDRRTLCRAALRALVTRPRQTVPALVWSVRAARHERGALRVFGEAAYLAARLGHVDHLHAHFAHTSASLALVIGRLTGRPFSFTGHARDMLVATRPALLRRKIAAAHFVVGVSEFSRDWLATVARPHDRGSIVVVRNGIDLTPIKPAGTGRAGRSPQVLTVARLVDKKGIDVAVRACAALTQRGVDHTWLVVGDGPLRGDLEKLAERLGVDEVMTFAGARPHAGVRAAMGAAAVFALPCRIAGDGDRDVAPVAVVEALAAGVPVVTTAVGGIPETARDGETALIVPPGDAATLADAVESILGDASLGAGLARDGRRVVEAQHDVRASVTRLRELFAA